MQKWHINDNVQTHEIQFKYCPLQQNDADILTKTLLGNRFWSTAVQLGLTVDSFKGNSNHYGLMFYSKIICLNL